MKTPQEQINEWRIDAARYRHIRKTKGTVYRTESILRGGISFAMPIGNWEPDQFQGWESKLDAAIDAEIKASNAASSASTGEKK